MKLLTRQELALKLDVHPQSIVRWQAAGLPIAKRGQKGQPHLYHEGAVCGWRNKRERKALEFTRARARRERAQALLAEQTVAIRAKRLVRRVDVDRVWAREVAVVSRNLRAWVKPLARRLNKAAKGGLPDVQAAIETAFLEKLTEFAKPNPK